VGSRSSPELRAVAVLGLVRDPALRADGALALLRSAAPPYR
jgi:hypothetical protein